jgi:peptidoglycan/xylan/chitin deacetylase (PgdA/CDA1 family)
VVHCRSVLVSLTGGPGVAFRPSGTDDGTVSPGDQILSVAAEAGYATVLGFDVDPLDYDDPGAAVVTQRTLAAVKPGSIVSLHFGHAGTVQAIPAILDGLEQRNLTPVTVSTLLG